jgi:hypothetical protein
VQEAAQRLAVPVRDALRRLEDEALLAREAERRGFAAHPVVREASRQAAVQALLAAEVERVEISEAEIAAAYAKQKDRFDRAEQRGSFHVLVKPGSRPEPAIEAKARAIAARVVGELQDAMAGGVQGREAIAERYHHREVEGLQLVAETVPPYRVGGGLDKRYEQALFAIGVTGEVHPEPVRSMFGWHAVALTEVVPPERTSLEEAAPRLREELAAEARQAAFDALLRRLEAATPVAWRQEAVERALASDRLAVGAR